MIFQWWYSVDDVSEFVQSALHALCLRIMNFVNLSTKNSSHSSPKGGGCNNLNISRPMLQKQTTKGENCSRYLQGHLFASFRFSVLVDSCSIRNAEPLWPSYICGSLRKNLKHIKLYGILNTSTNSAVDSLMENTKDLDTNSLILSMDSSVKDFLVMKRI